MSFTEEKVYSVLVSLVCDKCKNFMHFTGQVYATGKPGYVHRCDCGHEEIHRKEYPAFEYRAVISK